MIMNKTHNPNDTPLHLATRSSCSLEVMSSLLQKGVNINARNKAGWAPLHIAVVENSYNKAKMLLEAGADVNATIPNQEDDTPLHLVAWTNNVKMAKLLIAYGANLNLYGEEGTPLETAHHYAANDVKRLIQAELYKREVRRARISARHPQRIVTRKWCVKHYHPGRSYV